MQRPPQSFPSPQPTTLVEKWLGFFIKHRGRWSAAEERTFRAWACWGKPHITPTDLDAALAAARTIWSSPDRQIHVCVGSECGKFRGRPTSDQLAALEAHLDCPVHLTDCQNECRHAPTAVVQEHTALSPVRDLRIPTK